MNLNELYKRLVSINERLDRIRIRLSVLDNTVDEAREIKEANGLLDKIELQIIRCEDWVSAIEYRVDELLGENHQ